MMFGDILFATIPFATFDDGDEIVPYAQIWINQCPEENDWENTVPEAPSTAICHGDR